MKNYISKLYCLRNSNCFRNSSFAFEIENVIVVNARLHKASMKTATATFLGNYRKQYSSSNMFLFLLLFSAGYVMFCTYTIKLYRYISDLYGSYIWNPIIRLAFLFLNIAQSVCATHAAVIIPSAFNPPGTYSNNEWYYYHYNSTSLTLCQNQKWW